MYQAAPLMGNDTYGFTSKREPPLTPIPDLCWTPLRVYCRSGPASAPYLKLMSSWVKRTASA